ncbi:1542_t:CDS:2 [Funneliformis geosporum]|uniref:1542_t:CDS:1 n=1 Tax=Funneliformis geosporum TaxID=1117311 RepID=A0A9W4SS24_9GLOM|nr:1542_t:CDS:2 [Funneliformis geosporum]
MEMLNHSIDRIDDRYDGCKGSTKNLLSFYMICNNIHYVILKSAIGEYFSALASHIPVFCDD